MGFFRDFWGKNSFISDYIQPVFAKGVNLDKKSGYFGLYPAIL